MEKEVAAGLASTTRSKAWGIVFLGFGLFHIADWLYVGMGQTSRLLAGLGLLLFAPEAFRNPINLGMPLREAFKPALRSSGVQAWLAVAGVVLLVISLLVSWI